MARNDQTSTRSQDRTPAPRPVEQAAVPGGPESAHAPGAAPRQEAGREQLPAHEQGPRQKDQHQRVEQAIAGMRKKLRTPKKKKNTKIPQVRDDLTVQVEKIMEAGLEEAYAELSAVEQQEFKIKGEETALQIRQLMKATHVKVKKIFRLLFDWLKMLPGINRFFLEQEAKIKTDKIVGLKHHHHDHS